MEKNKSVLTTKSVTSYMKKNKIHILALSFLFIVHLIVFNSFFTEDLSQNIIEKIPDPCLNAYILEYDYNKLTNLEFEGFFDAHFLHPSNKALAFTEHLLGHQPFYFVIRSISGNTLVSYNLLSMLNFFLCAVGLYFLGTYLFKKPYPALFLALAFTYSSVLIQHLSHFQIFSFPWIGFIFLYFLKFMKSQQFKDGLKMLAFWILQSLGSYYLAYIIDISIFFLFIIFFFYRRKEYNYSFYLKFLGIGAIYLLFLIPLALPYIEVKHFYEFKRSIVQNVSYSAHFPLSFITPSSNNTIFGFLYDEIQKTYQLKEMQEKVLFAGFLVIFFTIYQFIIRKKNTTIREFRYLVILGIILFVLALGPIFNGMVIKGKVVIPLPYLLFYYIIPGFSSMRVPTRFGIVFTLIFIIISAYGYRYLIYDFLKEKTRRYIAPIILILLVVELFPNIHLAKVGETPIAFKKLTEQKDMKGIFVFPSSFRNNDIGGKYILYNSKNPINMVNGHSGYYTKSNFYSQMFAHCINDESSMNNLFNLGISHVIVLSKDMTDSDKAKLDKALNKKSLLQVQEYKDGSILFKLNPTKSKEKLEVNTLLPQFKWSLLDNKYLFAFNSSEIGGYYTSNRKDLFETITFTFYNSENKVLKTINKDVLIPAVFPKNNDYMFYVKLPEELDMSKAKTIKLTFKKLNNRSVTLSIEGISNIHSTNKAIPKEWAKDIDFNLEKKPTSLEADTITQLHLILKNNGKNMIPALGEGSVVFSRDDIMVGLKFANSEGKYRSAFLSQWIDEKGKESKQHSYVSWFPFASWMSSDLESGKTMKVPLNIKVPSKKGSYKLKIKYFQDLGYAKKGSSIIRVKNVIKELTIPIEVK